MKGLGIKTTRRQWLQISVGAAVTSLLGGCARESSGSDDSYDVILEYEMIVGTEPDQLPEEFQGVRDNQENPKGRRDEGYKWVVIEIFVQEGELDMQEIWFRSRVETEDRYYELDGTSSDLTEGIQSRGGIKEGGYGIAFYQVPQDSESVTWNLEETHQEIKAEER